MSTSQAVLESLNADLALEHAAIYQYIVHAAQLRDTLLSRTILEMAREEMWHFEWLVEAIGDCGGTPTIARSQVHTSPLFGESLDRDVEAEVDALEHYGRTLDLLGDGEPRLRRLIERIVDDERHHRATFAAMAAEVAKNGEAAYSSEPVIGGPEAGAAAPLMDLEYEGILRYLWNKYGADDPETADRYFDLAIAEMRHGHWISQYFAGLGEPTVTEGVNERVLPAGSAADARALATAHERSARAAYSQAAEALAGSAMEDDMQRMATQHAYHRYVLDEVIGSDGAG